MAHWALRRLQLSRLRRSLRLLRLGLRRLLRMCLGQALLTGWLALVLLVRLLLPRPVARLWLLTRRDFNGYAEDHLRCIFL